jgi:Metal-dependent hydrolases of the beta-lactamase superfamily I
LKVTFLGTGTSQGVPVIACPCAVCHSSDEMDKRLRSSVMIEVEGRNIVIDSGPDFRQQMLRANVLHLDAILFTHEHKDHIAGLDDVRAYNYVQKQPTDVYAEERVQWAIKQEFSYVFAENKYPGVPEVNLHSIDNHTFCIKGVTIIPVRAMHFRLPLLGYRIGDFAYITDANHIAKQELEKLVGVKCLVLNALRKEKHISHFSLKEAIQIIDEIKPEQAYLTHISHQMGFHREVEVELPENIHFAYDGLVLEM